MPGCSVLIKQFILIEFTNQLYLVVALIIQSRELTGKIDNGDGASKFNFGEGGFNIIKYNKLLRRFLKPF